MVRKVFLIFLFLQSVVFADTLSIPTTYSTNGQVTATNLNGNFQGVASVINGGLDNNNANTTSGYRFFETKSSLPTAGSQGRTVYLTSDNTLNLDTGSAWIKSVVVSGTLAAGDIIYYSGSAWVNLAKGTTGQALSAATTPTWSGMTTQGDVEYHNGTTRAALVAGTSGLFLKTQGSGANPKWDIPRGNIGASIIAASTITLGTDGNIFVITGNTAISTINSALAGIYVLEFTGTASVADSSNQKLAGTFNATADDTLTLFSDGSVFYEIARSGN